VEKIMAKISVYLITKNEALKIKDAIESVLWADEIIVADSESTDDTIKIAESLGAKVVQIPFKGFGDLRNQAISHCNFEWIFSLDADERCTEETKNEILQITNSVAITDVYFIPRKNIFLGKWIKHAYPYPDYRQPQLFRKNSMEYDADQVHEGYILKTNKNPGFLKNPIWQIPYLNLEELLNKANRYSTLGAIKLQQKNIKSGLGKAIMHAIWAFLRHYFLKCGFLDGWAGFIIALGNFEGTFYRYAKLWEKNLQK
jgi:glycosyltransferase involved in cell wall biosynthesis